VGLPMPASHAALWASTGRPEMSAFRTSSEGNIGQLGAPGTEVPAAAGPTAVIGASPTPAMSVTNTTATLDVHPVPMVVICSRTQCTGARHGREMADVR